MPLYQYECENCGKVFDLQLSLKDHTSKTVCQECDGDAVQIMTLGGIQDDHPVWLDDSIRRQIQDTDDPNIRPIETRQEYKRYLKENGFIPTN